MKNEMYQHLHAALFLFRFGWDFHHWISQTEDCLLKRGVSNRRALVVLHGSEVGLGNAEDALEVLGTVCHRVTLVRVLGPALVLNKQN